MKELKEKYNEINILFVIDTTGSMVPWMKQLKESINDITDFVKCATNKIVRVGFIAYKDICDKKN